MWLSRQQETDDNELGERTAKALRHENTNPEMTRAIIAARTWFQVGRPTQRELGHVDE